MGWEEETIHGFFTIDHDPAPWPQSLPNRLRYESAPSPHLIAVPQSHLRPLRPKALPFLPTPRLPLPSPPPVTPLPYPLLFQKAIRQSMLLAPLVREHLAPMQPTEWPSYSNLEYLNIVELVGE